jgi:hypothetical protein
MKWQSSRFGLLLEFDNQRLYPDPQSTIKTEREICMHAIYKTKR